MKDFILPLKSSQFKFMKKLLFSILLFLTIVSFSQTATIGLLQNSTDSYNGYTLFAPTSYSKTYLIDNCGKLIHTWSSSYNPGLSVYLLENGNLLHTGTTKNSYFNSGGSGGIVEIIDPNSTVTWSYKVSSTTECQHHDVEALPNGNVLIISWESKTTTEATDAGRNPSSLNNALWSEKIIEVNPTTSEIVWEWHVWDHLVQDYASDKNNYGVVADHPELLNINYYAENKSDWLHINSVDYNAELDQILLSSHELSEIWIIDHSTTTQQAAGHTGGNSGKGGDFLFRWGNPATYDKGTSDDQVFYKQHDVRWVPKGYPGEGNIMVFNNGQGRPGSNYSSIDELTPVPNGFNYEMSSGVFLPTGLSWQYKAPVLTDFYTGTQGGGDRQPNGNTLICEADEGHFFEVDPEGNTVWEYINPVSSSGPLEQGTSTTGTSTGGRPGSGGTRISNGVFRATRYNPDYAGLQYYDLTPGEPIETNPIDYTCDTDTSSTKGSTNIESMTNKINIYPNPVGDYIYLETELKQNLSFILINATGEVVLKEPENMGSAKINVSQLKTGLYFYQVSDNQTIISSGKLIIE